jgi:hypothetical protein
MLRKIIKSEAYTACTFAVYKGIFKNDQKMLKVVVLYLAEKRCRVQYVDEMLYLSQGYTDWKHTSMGGSRNSVPDSCCLYETHGCGNNLFQVERNILFQEGERYLPVSGISASR